MAPPATRRRPGVLLAVAAGGALGAPARYGVASLAPVAPGAFPWSTLLINVTGSLAIGIALAVVLYHFPPSHYARPLVVTGFVGAYTTYSTFAVETDLLARDGRLALAVLYTATMLVFGLAAAAVGLVIGGTRRRVG